MEDQDIDPDIMNMVAAMCGDYSDIDNDHKDERYSGTLVYNVQLLHSFIFIILAQRLIKK